MGADQSKLNKMIFESKRKWVDLATDVSTNEQDFTNINKLNNTRFRYRCI